MLAILQSINIFPGHVLGFAGVPALLQMVRYGNPNTQQQACAVLRDLAYAPEHRSAIATAGAIPVLVDVLSIGSPQQTCIHAASCLRSIALNEPWAEKASFYAVLVG